MAHQIGKNDAQEGTEMAWHKLTKVSEKINTEDCFLTKWDVKKRPLLNVDGGSTEYCEIVCTDDPSIIIGEPVHKDTYTLIPNSEFLGVVREALLTIGGGQVVSVGSVCDRGRVFVTVKIPQCPEFEAAGRKFVPYLNFLSSHDKSAAFMVNASNICTVCNNTFSYNLQDKGAPFRARVLHSKNTRPALDKIDLMIGAYVGTQARFKAIMDGLGTTAVTKDVASNFFTGLLTFRSDPAGAKEVSTRRENQVNRLTELFSNGLGNGGNTKADVFSAITDYYTHESSGGENLWRQVVSSEYGAGQAMKGRAWGILTDEYAFNQVVNIGAKVLASN